MNTEDTDRHVRLMRQELLVRLRNRPDRHRSPQAWWFEGPAEPGCSG